MLASLPSKSAHHKRQSKKKHLLPAQPPHVVPPAPAVPPRISPPRVDVAQLLAVLEVQPFLLVILGADDVRPPPPGRGHDEPGGGRLQPCAQARRVGGYAVERRGEGDRVVAVAGAVALPEGEEQVGQDEVED